MKRGKGVITALILRFMETAVSIAKESIGGRAGKALRRGNGGYADWVMIAIHAYKEAEDESYRSVVDKLKVTPPIRDLIELSVDDLPNPSTLCKAMDDLMMSVWRALLQQTTTLFDVGEIAAIDGTSFDRVAASRRYARRTDYRFLAMKTTVLTDCKTGAILDIHYSTSRPHDTQIGWQVLTRNLNRLSILTGDKGYDWADLRTKLHDNDVRPLIKHREFDSLDKAHNARMDDDIYHQRSSVETQIRVINQRYGNRLAARIWYKQFKELALKAAVNNIDEAIGATHC